tara:strand:- start:5113 stop:5613 length:501 start_codon:yes stop_codon:yes gene_type:complete
MSSSTKIINFIFNTIYWKEYKEYSKIKDVLSAFFKGEDTELQNSFINSFDYPENMINPPVRFEVSSGDIYYTINFKSKELFENSGTKEKALSNSLAVLDKFLPLGVTSYVSPTAPIHIPDTFSLLCSLKIESDVTPKTTVMNIIGSILKPLIIIVILGASLKYLFV